MNEEILKNELAKLHIDLSKNQLDLLNIYLTTLLEYNEHTNLTALKTKEDIYLKHFYDSLTILEYIPDNSKVLDIGTGAGFPGLVLAIFKPTSHFTLLDSNNKKTKFLAYLNTKLQLKNVEIINMRAEEYVKNNLEQFDIVTSRAVADLKILLELSLPALKISGKFIAMKAKVEKEMLGLEPYFQELKGTIIAKKEFTLPLENSKRTILIIEHNAKTNSQYPRTYDKILKKPLKKTLI